MADISEETIAAYVLGRVPEEQARALEACLASDPGLTQRLEDWRRTLEPLSGEDALPRPPDALWRRIEAVIDRNAPDTADQEKKPATT